MDDPFGALDSRTRQLMQALPPTVWLQHCETVLSITHDIDAAIFPGGVAHVMTVRPGRIRTSIVVTILLPGSLDALTSEPFIVLKRGVPGLVPKEAVIADNG